MASVEAIDVQILCILTAEKAVNDAVVRDRVVDGDAVLDRYQSMIDISDGSQMDALDEVMELGLDRREDTVYEVPEVVEEVVEVVSEVEDMKCYICYGVHEEDDMFVLRCDHAFCKPCLEQWLGRNRTCPMCREEVCTVGLGVLNIVPYEVQYDGTAYDDEDEEEDEEVDEEYLQEMRGRFWSASRGINEVSQEWIRLWVLRTQDHHDREWWMSQGMVAVLRHINGMESHIQWFKKAIDLKVRVAEDDRDPEQGEVYEMERYCRRIRSAFLV